MATRSRSTGQTRHDLNHAIANGLNILDSPRREHLQRSCLRAQHRHRRDRHRKARTWENACVLILLSPAKSLDYESRVPTRKHTEPRMLDQSSALIEVMRTK